MCCECLPCPKPPSGIAGIRGGDSSQRWFRDHLQYHGERLAFDHVYGFEGDRARMDSTAPDAEFPASFMERLTYTHAFVGTKDNAAASPPVVDLVAFLQAHARVEDFVMLKVDIEGAEYELLDALTERGAWPLVDEFMVELHYAHPAMKPWGWAADGAITLERAHHMLTALRRHGVRAHYWP